MKTLEKVTIRNAVKEVLQDSTWSLGGDSLSEALQAVFEQYPAYEENPAQFLAEFAAGNGMGPVTFQMRIRSDENVGEGDYPFFVEVVGISS